MDRYYVTYQRAFKTFDYAESLLDAVQRALALLGQDAHLIGATIAE